MTQRISLDAIAIGSGRRKTDKVKVKALADSIAAIGLRTPITVLSADADGKHRLVTGRNRLEAHRLLGVADIETHIEADKLTAEMWEIAENLHRSELTAMQRSVLLGRWVKLKAKKIKRDGSAQLAPNPLGGRPAVTGITAAARELGIPKRTAQRAVYITEHLTKAAQREAAKLGLENNQRALERAAKREGQDDQVASLRQSVERASERKSQRVQMKAVIAGTDTPKTAKDAFLRWLHSLDVVLRTEVRIMLLGIEDMEAYLDEIEKAFARGGAVLH